jgi:hypothetical protein
VQRRGRIGAVFDLSMISRQRYIQDVDEQSLIKD